METKPDYCPIHHIFRPCSLRLCPISRLNSDLKGRNFGDLSDLKLAVKQFISSYDPEWFKSVFKLYLAMGAPAREKCPREWRIL